MAQGGAQQVKSHPWFALVNWSAVSTRGWRPVPIKPAVVSSADQEGLPDSSNFDDFPALGNPEDFGSEGARHRPLSAEDQALFASF